MKSGKIWGIPVFESVDFISNALHFTKASTRRHLFGLDVGLSLMSLDHNDDGDDAGDGKSYKYAILLKSSLPDRSRRIATAVKNKNLIFRK